MLIISGMTFFQACNKPADSFELRNGDLLFSVGKGESELLKAIQNATSKNEEVPYSHVGIVAKEKGKFYVIEAETWSGVTKTPLDSFLQSVSTLEGKPVVAVGRLKPRYDYAIQHAVINARKYLGRKYDYAYDEENEDVYCSELVRFSFLDSNGNPLFAPLAMSFKNKATGEVNPYWVEHFRKLNKEIPEGKPGTNPADMAKSEILDIVWKFW